MLPASLAIVRVGWPDPHERAKALGLWAGCNGLALALGPVLGGFLIDAFGWRSIFAVAVPLGIAAMVLAPLCVQESSDPKNRRFDAAGQLLGAVALGSLALAGIESHNWPVLGVAALSCAATALVLFIWIERRLGQAALVPLDLFGVAQFRGTIAATAGMTFGMYGVLFLLPLSWQSAGLFSALGAAIALMPMALVFVVVSSFSGRLTRKFGTTAMTSGGEATIGFGLVSIAVTECIASPVFDEIGLVLAGIGMGLATGPLVGAAVGAVSAQRSGSAAALVNVARMVGATLGVALLGALYARAGGGPRGLETAMLLGGGVQLTSALTAWGSQRVRAGEAVACDANVPPS